LQGQHLLEIDNGLDHRLTGSFSPTGDSDGLSAFVWIYHLDIAQQHHQDYEGLNCGSGKQPYWHKMKRRQHRVILPGWSWFD
jgi:hypothetical protein